MSLSAQAGSEGMRKPAFYANMSNSIYGASSTVQPKARQALIIIKA
jgi:hypothetical protein